jgi:hypothetical protein
MTGLLGDVVTVKVMPFDAWLATVTITLPVVAPVGTEHEIELAAQVGHVAAVPLNFTVLVLCVAPKVVPVRVTADPIGPLTAERLVSAGETVNESALDGLPPTVATKFPVVAGPGTTQVMLVALHEVGMQALPLNVKLLDPCVAVNPVPVTVTLVPTGLGDVATLERKGVTVNRTPLDKTLLTVTITLPVEPPLGTVTLMAVALHVLTVRLVPFRVAVEPPCDTPKLDPLIVNVAPMFPEDNDRLEIVGGDEPLVALKAPSKEI